MDDNQWEPDEEFFLKLTLIPGRDSEEVRLGRTSIMEITILNDDGTICSGKINVCSRDSAEASLVFFFSAIASFYAMSKHLHGYNFPLAFLRAWHHSVREARNPREGELR